MSKDGITIETMKPRGEDGMKTFSIRIKTEINDELIRLADQTNRSKNQVIGILLEESLKVVTIKPKEE